LTKNGIETRPIVAGDITKSEMLRYFDYSIHGNLKNSELIDKNGFFVGNHDFDISAELNLLKSVLGEI